MILWKDHTAIQEAEEINALSKSWGGVDYIKYEGGIYSSEWFWAKILHTVRADEEVAKNAFTWMEHCDYMTYLLIENKNLKTFKRSRCAAGHKAMWHTEWKDCLRKNFIPTPPLFRTVTSKLIRRNLYLRLCRWYFVFSMVKAFRAESLNRSGGRYFDAHAGAVGARIEEKSLVRVMGTSTCDIIVSSKSKYKNTTVKGICGQVDGSVIPGMIGLEAGQSAFGDVLAWFKTVMEWPLNEIVLQSPTLNEDQKKH